MWESQGDFQRVWEGWKAGFLAFHAFHTLPFPRPVFCACDVGLRATSIPDRDGMASMYDGT